MRFSFRVFLAVAGLFAPAAFAGHSLGTLTIAGDSLSAGYQNNQLIDCYTAPELASGFCFAEPNGQRFGYANVIAQQAGQNLNLHLIPPPGFPQIITADKFDVAAGFNTGPLAAGGTSQTLDVSVPGFTLGAMLGYQAVCPPGAGDPQVPFPIQAMAAAILNPTCGPAPTEIQEAAIVAQSNPGTAILWIGSNDALFPLLFAGQKATAPFTFAYLYNIAISTMSQSSNRLVVATIPDVTLLPYLTSVQKLAFVIGMPAQQVQQVFGLNSGDMVTPYAFAVLDQMKQANHFGPLPDTIPDPITGQGEVPVVIRAADIRSLRASIAFYNAAITIEAALHHAVVVDIHGLVDQIAARGVVVNGQRLTTDFMGGLFSLDGVHPTNTGYAIIANEFIKTMNRALGTGIPPANVNHVAANDPMVYPGGAPGRNKSHVSPGMANGLRGLMHHQQ
jgi:hypothetical protein